MYVQPELHPRHPASNISSIVVSSYAVPSLISTSLFEDMHGSRNPSMSAATLHSLNPEAQMNSERVPATTDSILPLTARPRPAHVNVSKTNDMQQEASADAMKTLSAIICCNCLFLEFPGCDIHGMLYSDKVVSEEEEASTSLEQSNTSVQEARLLSDVYQNESLYAAYCQSSSSRLHAKCMQCEAATNNVLPFRDGCRKCKGPTLIQMWNTTQQELARAYEAFPIQLEQLDHTVLACEFCHSVIFPRARDQLTQRTDQHMLTVATSGAREQASNYQLSMPHVEGCPRRGKPLQGVAICLTRAELKFAYDRIRESPMPANISAKSEYQDRLTDDVTSQNHLHQIYLKLLCSLLRSHDPASPEASEPLKKIRDLLACLKPLSLFCDWAPPKKFQRTIIPVSSVSASTERGEAYSAAKILDIGAWWESKPFEGKADDREDEWILLTFLSPHVVAFVEIKWRLGLAPSSFTVKVSTDDIELTTVAIVTDVKEISKVAIGKVKASKSVRIILHASAVGQSFGLESIIFYALNFDQLHTSSESVLREMESWLSSACVSPDLEVRGLALEAFAKFVLASGSLQSVIDMANCLLLSTRAPSDNEEHVEADNGSENWVKMDTLSEIGQTGVHQFLADLSRELMQFVINCEKNRQVLDRHTFEQMLKRLGCQNAVKLAPAKSVGGPSVSNASNASDLQLSLGNDSTMPLLLSIFDASFRGHIKRRSQVALLLVHVLGEISLWNLKRMQAGVDYADAIRDKEWLVLEAPFSIEVTAQLLGSLDNLIRKVMAKWLPVSPLQGAMEIETLEQQTYDTMKTFCDSLDEAFRSLRCIRGISLGFQMERSFSLEGFCGSLLQIITANLRRLVVSRVDPSMIILENSPYDPKRVSLHSAMDHGIIATLEQLIALGNKRSDPFFQISLSAAAALDAGMEVFYPSSLQRTRLLTSKMGDGAVLEVQVRWPVQDRDREDPRFERFLLLLQLECATTKISHALRGTYDLYLYLVLQLLPTQNTQEFLHYQFAHCLRKAGFLSWQVIAGAQEVSISLQRHLHWDRMQKMSQESGVAWVRVYPCDIASYEQVLQEIDDFLSQVKGTNAQIAG